MCTFIAVSKKITTAIGLGISVMIVQAITVPANNLILTYLLKPGALAWAGFSEVDLTFLGLISYIGFKQTGIFFDRPIRKKGKSKSTVAFLIKYGMDALLSSTGAPVSIITKIGMFSLFSISIFILIVIIIKITNNPNGK